MSKEKMNLDKIKTIRVKAIIALILTITFWLVGFYSGWVIVKKINVEWYHWADLFGCGLLVLVLFPATVSYNYTAWFNDEDN